MLYGVDISAYQSGPPPGKDFYWIKATEGVGYVDQHFPGWLAQVEAWGALGGLYHFSDMGDPIAEADFFLSNVRAYLKPGVLVCLDHETSSGSASHDAWFAQQWSGRVQAAVRMRPVLYCNQSYVLEGRCAGLGSNPLWLARYSAITSEGIGPWTRSTFQQYTDSPEDEDVFFGTRTDWLALAGAAPAPITPHQEDDMPDGQLNNGPKAVTPISVPKGKYAAIGFIADNGVAGKPAPKLRVAVSHGGGRWAVTEVEVDSAKGKTVVHFSDAAATDGLSIERVDTGDVPVAWDIS